jgi:ELWxxDGT repeat protein
VAKALFEGANAAGQVGLWMTDGTAAGTEELTGITGAYTGGLFGSVFSLGSPFFTFSAIDPGFTVIKDQAVFQGRDATGQFGLWVTDGTAAGTHEITGISLPGFSPAFFTVFNGEVLFDAAGPAGKAGLWETDGTASGTHQLTGVPGFGRATVFNGEVLFEAAGTGGPGALWVTDGTAAGTHELTGIVGADPLFGLSPSGFTVFNGKVLFSGSNTTDQFGLWVTDGTAAGTHELTTIAGANTGSLGLEPIDLTVLNGEVLFDGLDAAGKHGLSVTDGTAAGTHEITGIAGASTSGVLGTFTPGFTVFDGKVLFRGVNAAGQFGLWVTDGTAAGTHELTGISGANSIGVLPFDIVNLSPNGLPFDLNGDANSDVVFQNNGQAGVWLMNGATPIAEVGLGNPGPSWHIVASRDVNGDGKADLIWQNTDGTGGIWLMNGTTPIAETGFASPGACTNSIRTFGTLCWGTLARLFRFASAPRMRRISNENLAAFSSSLISFSWTTTASTSGS